MPCTIMAAIITAGIGPDADSAVHVSLRARTVPVGSIADVARPKAPTRPSSPICTGRSFALTRARRTVAENTAKKTLVELKRDPLITASARASHDDDDETSRTENELSDGETPEAVLASKEIASTVNAAIEALSDDLRQAITLREIEGLSYEEIA